MSFQSRLSRLIFTILFFGSYNVLAQLKVNISPFHNCIYVSGPQQIINPNCVVYQDCNTRKVFHPDIHSYRSLERELRHFGLDKNGVYFNGNFVHTDTTGFKLVGEVEGNEHFIWKTKDRAFSDLGEIKGVDVATFSNVDKNSNSSYCKDKFSVYYIDKKIIGADIASFRTEGNGVVYDKNWVYNKSTILTFNGNPLHSINRFLAKTDEEVIYLPSMSVVKSMDAISLHGLSSIYSTDRSHLFCDSSIVEGANLNTSGIKTFDELNSLYLTDCQHIYAWGTPFKTQLDPSTFHPFTNADIFYDQNGIYYRTWNKGNGEIAIKYPFNYDVPVTPKNASISLNYRFIIYNGQVYDLSQHKLLIGLKKDEIERVKLLDNRLSWNVPALKAIDPHIKLFQASVVGNGSKLFYRDSLIANIDARFLTVLGYNYYSYKGKILRLEGKSFVPLKGADAKSFRAGLMTFDKNYVYYGSLRLINNKDAELLAIFNGPTYGGDERFYLTTYYFYHNDKGYWIKISDNPKIVFIGKFINKKTINFPENFD